MGKRESLTGIHFNARYLLSALFASVIMISILTACSYYTTFSSRIKQIDFTFEYPRGWGIPTTEQYPDLIYTSLHDPNISETESPVKTDVDVFLGLESKADQKAQDIINGNISSSEKFHNYKLIKQDTIKVDGFSGYQASYTYEFASLPKGTGWFYIPTKDLDIAIPRNGRVYEIRISASQNRWNAGENDIQHILDTFKWK